LAVHSVESVDTAAWPAQRYWHVAARTITPVPHVVVHWLNAAATWHV
jgi:hypothetical protein